MQQEQEQTPCDLHATYGGGGVEMSENGWSWVKGWGWSGVIVQIRGWRCRAGNALCCQLKTCQQFATTINRATKLGVTIASGPLVLWQLLLLLLLRLLVPSAKDPVMSGIVLSPAEPYMLRRICSSVYDQVCPAFD